MAVAEDGVFTGRSELAPRSALPARVDGVPHRVTAGHAEAAGDHLGEPFRLAFDDLEEARPRLEHADERESSRVR